MKKTLCIIALLAGLSPSFAQVSIQGTNIQIGGQTPGTGTVNQVNGTPTISQTTLNLKDSSGAGKVTFSNPSGGDVTAVVATPSITVTAGSGLSGGGVASLGGSVTLSLTAAGIAGVLQGQTNCNTSNGYYYSPFSGTCVALTSGSVTNFSVGSWPSWLTPTVSNPSTTPQLSVTAAYTPVNKAGDQVTGILGVGGTGTSSNQGNFLMWNSMAGTGSSDFVNYKGSGAGGFNWFNQANGTTPTTPIASMDASGNMAIGALHAQGDGNFSGLLGVGGKGSSSSQGAYTMWGSITGSGASDFVNYKGGGVGGFNWFNQANGTTPTAPIASMDASGGMTIGALHVQGDGKIDGLFGVGGKGSSSSQGAYTMWGSITGSGASDFVNYKGGGAGGFNWFNQANGTTPTTPIASMDASGNMAIGASSTVGGKNPCLQDGTNCPASATIPSTTNLIAGNGSGSGSDSGIAPASVCLSSGTNCPAGVSIPSTSNVLAGNGSGGVSASGFDPSQVCLSSGSNCPSGISGTDYWWTQSVGSCSISYAAGSTCNGTVTTIGTMPDATWYLQCTLSGTPLATGSIGDDGGRPTSSGATVNVLVYIGAVGGGSGSFSPQVTCHAHHN